MSKKTFTMILEVILEGDYHDDVDDVESAISRELESIYYVDNVKQVSWGDVRMVEE